MTYPALFSLYLFVRQVKEPERLDTVVENVGNLTNDHILVEGIKSTCLLNVVSTVLLELLSLSKLRKSAAVNDRTGLLAIVGLDLQYLAQLINQNCPGSLSDVLNFKNAADWVIGKLLNPRSVWLILRLAYIQHLQTLSALYSPRNYRYKPGIFRACCNN